MKTIALFLWLTLPIGGYATFHTLGTPHVIWSYRFVPNGDPHNPFAARHYTSCTGGVSKPCWCEGLKRAAA